MAAFQTEYQNEREAADAQLKLVQLGYQGSIQAYITEFRALNNFVRATAETLKEKVDLVMTLEILRMRFTQYFGEFADDEGFLQATYQVGLQVYRMKMLEKVREATRRAKHEEKIKEEKGENEWRVRQGEKDKRNPETLEK